MSEGINTARCKFRVASVKDFGPSQGKTVELHTQYDAKLCEEDRAFSKYTPSGTMTVSIFNPAVDHIFKPGADVYVDITPVG